MSIKKFLTSRVFLKHLVLSVVIIIAIIVIVLQQLKSYTHHGEAYPVPDFTGLTYNEIEATAQQAHLKYEIIDSMHFDGANPGAVVEQVPEPGFKVKKNRIVFLTINSTVPEVVVLPKLTDVSFRQALGLLENCGLKPGKITYQPSEFNNLVLHVEQDSKVLNQDDVVQKGSSIDMVIGSNSGIQDTPLPNLTGMTYTEAESVLTSYMLNTGSLIFDGTILSPEDSLAAIIWKQYPGKNIKLVSLGTSIDLWLTLDSIKILQPTQKEQK
jgi:beta-lactam-binding protein with PASTA domain